jgi:hypothetical protein
LSPLPITVLLYFEKIVGLVGISIFDSMA